MDWNDQIEKVIADEGEKCLSWAWLHDRSQKKYNKLDVIVNVPVITISTIVGSASIGSESLFQGFEQASVILGIFSIFVAILNTLGSYFAWGKRSEGHRISSINYSKAYNFIKIEMSLPRNQRLAIVEFIKLIKEQLERLKEISPQIPDDIIKDYKTKFDSEIEISKPEITNGLDKIEIFSQAVKPADIIANIEENSISCVSPTNEDKQQTVSLESITRTTKPKPKQWK
jgi:hypothetical protein